MKWIVFVIILTFPSLVLGGTISLTTSITTDILTTNQGEILFTLANSGDEAAYNVQASIITNYFSSQPIHVGTLETNKPYRGEISIIAEDALKEGNYPVVLLTEYTDSNGYPFSSVSPVTLTYKNPYSSRINGIFENIELSGKRSKNLVLKLKNMDQIEHEVDVKLTLPNELSSDITNKTVSVGSKKEKDVVFKISNFAGLEGSSYVILASIEYEDDYHYSSLTSSMVRIVEGKGFVIPKWFPIAGASVLIVIFLFYQIKSKFTINFRKEGKYT